MPTHTPPTDPSRRFTFPRWQRALALAVPLVASALSGAVVTRALVARGEATAEVRHSMRVMQLAEAVRIRMVDAETGQRGFLISGDERYLTPYGGAARDVWRHLGELRQELSGHPAQVALVDSVAVLAERRLGILSERVAIRRAQGFPAAREAVVSGGGRQAMDSLRMLLDSVAARERRSLALREAAESRRAASIFWLVSLGGALIAGAVLLTWFIFHRYAIATRAAGEELQESNERLQEQAMEVELQADELQAQAAQLEETVVELHATQDELQAQHTQLEGLAAKLEARNQELERTNRSLEEQTARAEEANRAKGDFLATMSHELRTPLNAVGGYAELLEMGVHGAMNDAQREALIRIRRNQRYLLGLIEDILNFARVEAGKIEVRAAPVPVAELLDGLEAVVAPLMAARHLAYTCHPCDPSLVARGDRERIEQVLLNLLTNAAKFTPEGGQVTVSAVAAGDEVLLRVSDTGRGIPAEQRQAVFEPFVQLKRTPSDGSAQGIGLGLAISRELARVMGGDLTVVSEPGLGSTFTLALDRVEPSAEDVDYRLEA